MQVTEADGVFQGGGVKGIGLVGALLEFYDHGWTGWKQSAGTSAGAIIAAYLACGHTPLATAELLERVPFRKFVDTGKLGKFVSGPWNVVAHRGFAKGEYFRHWMDEELKGRTFRDLRIDGTNSWCLKLIAADITNRQLLVLPDDLRHYRLQPDDDAPIDPDSFKVADAVRMSMSIPFFYEPVTLTHHASGDEATIVDGGIISNFPVWLFDVDHRDPIRPTFGFRLTGGRGVGSGAQRYLRALGWPAAMGFDLFHTASDAFDRRFMSSSTRVRTCAVDAGNVGTTDFDLSAEARKMLVDSGRRAARDFLASFDIDDYFNTFGRKLIGATTAADRSTRA